jgi:uncharacterized membrane protein
VAQFFLEYKSIIVFLHVMGAVVWVGGMIAIRFAAHPSFMLIESPQQRLEHIAHALGKLFSIVTPFVILLLVTAVLMIMGYGLPRSEFSFVAHVKEGIWLIMGLNLAMMIVRRNKAVAALKENDVARAKAKLEMIGKYMVPINIALGIVAISLGSFLSSVF